MDRDDTEKTDSEKTDSETETDVDWAMAERTAAMLRLSDQSVPTRVTLTKQRRRRVLALLAGGLTIGDAGQAVGLSGHAIRAERHRNPKWDEACAIAIELGTANNTESAEQRLLAIGLYGTPGSMATVRALETYLAANDKRYAKQPKPARTSLSLSQTNPDGSIRQITASSNLIAD